MGWQRGNGNRMRWHTSINPVINSRISEKEEGGAVEDHNRMVRDDG